MQTERVTILMPPAKKAAFNALAAERGLSLGEFFRQAGEKLAEDEADQEAELAALVEQVNEAIPKMHASFDRMEARLEKSHRKIDALLRAKGIRR